MALNSKQQRFCEEYLLDLNATQAAIRAGYSEKTAYSQGQRLLNHVEIASAIQDGADKRSTRTEIDADYVLNTIKETIERCRQSEPVLDRKGDPVMVDTPDGDEVPAYKFDSTGVLKGCELLGKNLKLFTDKVVQEVTGANGAPIENHHVWEIKVKRATPPKDKATKGKK